MKNNPNDYSPVLSCMSEMESKKALDLINPIVELLEKNGATNMIAFAACELICRTLFSTEYENRMRIERIKVKKTKVKMER